MLTIRTYAHVLTNRQRKNYLSSRVSTGAPRARAGVLRYLQARIARCDAELRRYWLESRWRSHLGRVRSTRVRSRP
jgi:hypothetical protein